jgi:transcription elongation factor Elf1
MGKRKSSKPPPKKQKPKLDVAFNCPFCNSSKSVSCLFDWDREIGTVQCQVCQVNFSTQINHLTEPIDVYSDWIDACEAENA